MQNKSFPKVQSSQGSYNNNGPGSQNVRLSPTEYDAANKHMKDRFIYALANSLGTKITVTTASDKITGILQSISDVNDSIPSLILKYPTKPGHIYDDEFLLIPESSISMIACENLDFTPKASSSTTTAAAANSSSANNQSAARKGFKIDTDISNIDSFKERDLQKWVPEEDDSSSLALALDDDRPSSDANKWDQFKANKDKFGIDAKFDENDYTVKLNVSNPNFKERMKFAETVSKEILSQSANGNLHIAEERGKLVDAENIDEEDKYSGVLRDNAESEKKLMNMLKTSKPDTSKSAAPVTPAQSKSLSSSSSGQYIPPNQRVQQVQKETPATAVKRSSPASTTPAAPTIAASAAPAAPITPVQLPEKPTTSQQAKDTKKASTNESAAVSKKNAVVPSKPAAAAAAAAAPSTPAAASGASATTATSTTSSTPAATPAASNTQHVQKPHQQQPVSQPTTGAATKQKSPQLQKQTFTAHGAETNQHQHQQQHPQQHQNQHQQHQQNIPQQLPPQIQQQQPQHMMRNQQFGYQPRNNMGNQQQYGSPSMQYRNHHNNTNHGGNNQYSQNYNNNNGNANQRMKKASPQFVFSHRPSDKAPQGSILGDKFNILLSAKKEYSSNKTNVHIEIIPMVPSFHASPSWPETTSESYSEIFTKENNSHTNMHMQQPVYMHPQAYPQNHQQPYMGFQVQPPYYFPIVPSYPVYLPNVSFPMMGGNQGMDKVYPNHARHGNNY